MSRHEVSRPAKARVPAPELLAAALVALAALTLGFSSFLRVQVVIDGEVVTVPSGATVSDVAEAGLTAAKPGDLLALDGRTVVGEGAGGQVRAYVDGERAGPARRLRGGERVRSAPGRDVLEAVVEEERAIPIPVAVTGSGPLVQLAATGSPGILRLRVGAVSGQVVASETVLPPSPMTVVRAPAPTPGRRIVALTFDDGPWPETTEAILDVLRDEEVPATFFLVGDRVSKHPGLVRRMVREGHVLGNHTLGHRRLDTASKKTVRSQIRLGAERIERVSGVKPRWFRPPGGYLDPVVMDEARRAREKVVLWSVDPQDWRRPGWKKIASRVVNVTRAGDVVLLHDGGGDREQTVQAVKRIISQLRRQGYRFVTLDELAEVRPAAVSR